jgi:hypothetical protein
MFCLEYFEVLATNGLAAFIGDNNGPWIFVKQNCD